MSSKKKQLKMANVVEEAKAKLCDSIRQKYDNLKQEKKVMANEVFSKTR